MTTHGIEVAVPGGRLAAWRLGDGGAGAPVVVAIHGITATSRSWLAVAAALGGRIALITPDLRGRGASRGLGPPFGLDAHAGDVRTLLDHLGLDRVVIAGHSLGAYVACRFAVTHPDRVSRLVLVDGGLPIPGLQDAADPQATVAASLGPAVARLRTEFPDRETYRAWWRAHPAFTGSDIDPGVLAAVADYDLCGEPPHLRASVLPEVVPADGRELVGVSDAARLTGEAVELHAPRGLDGAPPPMQPAEVVETWVAGAPDRRRAVFVPDTNHYTILMGAVGAGVVAAELIAACASAGPESAGPASAGPASAGPAIA